jgi:hypothetical protein
MHVQSSREVNTEEERPAACGGHTTTNPQRIERR